MKNSEWGAVAYLTHSQYGRNGEQIAINNSKDYYTGYSGGSADAAQSSSTVSTYAYNTTNGVLASSTGNISGIYDLSGGAWEYVAAYNSTEDSNKYVTNNGWGITAATASTKYATQYSNGTTYYNGAEIYNVGKIGDATKEVYAAKDVTVGSTTTKRNWFDDYSDFVASGVPFFNRGDSYVSGVGAGVFCSDRNSGNAGSSGSFCVVIVP